jgi:hypothetical protein
VLLFSSLAATAPADTLDLHPVADTTLIETQPDNNNGGQFFFTAGTTQNYPRVRGLVRFDVSALPSGAVINSVTLTLEMTKQPRDGYNSSTLGMHRMLQAWGEGDKTMADPLSPGLGAPATEGEATWNERMFGLHAWAAPGGAPGLDYADAVSSSVNVYGTGDSPFTFSSETGTVDDVALWQRDPNSNFGWMLKAEDEDINFTARRYASRENADFAPNLHIDYTVVPEPAWYALAGTALLGFFWKQKRRDSTARE